MTIGTLTTRQLNIFAHKATLALYFEKFKRPLSSEGAVCSYWRSKEDFMVKGIPPDLLAMMPRYRTLIQGSWNASETFEYRWESNDEEGLFCCFARLRQGLFILGFAIPDIKLLNGDVGEWTSPAEPSVLLDLPQFQIRG